jgi:hypothetical protein
MNWHRLALERWASPLRWVARAESGKRIAAGVTLVAFAGGIGMLLYAGFYATSMASRPGRAMVLGLAEAHSDDGQGLTRMELISTKGTAEGVFWPSVDSLLNETVALPRMSLVYGPPESWQTLQAGGVNEFLFGSRLTVQRAPPTISRGMYALASSIARSSWALPNQCGSDTANLRAPEIRAEAAHLATNTLILPSGCWDVGPDFTASIDECDSSAPRGIRLNCGAYVAAEVGSETGPPTALAAVVTGGPTARAILEANISPHSALAAPLEVSAPNQLRSLPAPQSGWFDIGYTSAANPPWKQLLNGFCETSRPAPSSAPGVQCGLPSASNIGTWRLSFQAAGLEGAFTARDWHLNLGNDGGISVLVASALQTPLDDFDVDPSWGVQLNLPGGFHILGTASGVDLVQADVSFGQVFGGVAPQGSFAGVQFDGETVSGDISALSSVGQVQIIGDVTARIGEFNVSSALSTSDFNFTVSRVLRNRATVQLSWSTSDGFGTAYTIPGGPTARLSWSTDNGLKFTVVSLISLGTQPFAVAPQGGMALGFTPPGAFNSTPPAVNFRLPFATAAQPPVPETAAARSASATVIIRFCVDGTTDGACRQAEVRTPLQLSVDGQLVTATGLRILLSPGFHVIAVPAELLPAHLVALGALTCNLTVAASTVAFCDLSVHYTGTP